MGSSIQQWTEQAKQNWWPWLLEYGSHVLFALITLVVGWWLINRVVNAIERFTQQRHADPMLSGFISSLVSALLRIMLLISVAGMLGIQTTSFIALLGAAGLAVGMALQGSLSNFAGGVLILFLRPFRAGDYIEAQGTGGTVESIMIFHTVLKTGDNKTVILPNGALSNGSIVNFSRKPTRRVDLNLGIDYGDDLQQARAILLAIANADERVLQEPKPVVYLTSLGDNSVNISLRMWVKSADYWGVFFELQEQAKERFDAEGINFPFPQRTVHLAKQAD
ncbi:mechanosensitive ion channel protein MscS [Thiopseudomonas alkaliphila]|uniref:mechanosensitive ion channel family protein n=1 Tax=Thiopseudomonas alkaliphila TaxID=1697053 RepID=UPI00069EBC04|nr:mechanosensitive ion channel domain-containing protein [Thiopseudomonas alkaliphila]AKX44066.1 mechanosensitive ion channel protein MscS [Thiopseudomonas alkaliphila]AKX46303.1 mechanosensitive ion channel protein MscS [Thiopseudomonas alkaliphila]AKX49372.1 mechanosensitive ion channel protein MscS [Thiopseudomonas alkaliphila]AKX52718.1 mechanosensitive ion channel protein MscS [Thiopseudomonas alkaliphila]AKX54364.1 mechanosensitive ion channel protein MscS [Thiopseudomonas alkaliphila]